MFTGLGNRARVERPGLPPLSPTAVRVLVAGITDLTAGEVREGRLDRLGELEDDLVHLTLRVLADDATAAGAV